MTPALTAERSAAGRSQDQRQRQLIERVRSRDSAGTVRLLEAWVHRRGLASLEAFCRDAVPALLSAADTDWLEACLHQPLERRLDRAEPAPLPAAADPWAPANDPPRPAGLETLAAEGSELSAPAPLADEPPVTPASVTLAAAESLGQGGDHDPSPLAASRPEWAAPSAPGPLADEPRALPSLETLAAPEPLGQGGEVGPSVLAATSAAWGAPFLSAPAGNLNQGPGGWPGALPEGQEPELLPALTSRPSSGAEAPAPSPLTELGTESAALGESGPRPRDPGLGQGLEQSLSAAGVVLADAPQRLRRKLFGSLGKARVLMQACIEEAISTLHPQGESVSESEPESEPIATTPASNSVVGSPPAWPDTAMPLPPLERAAGQPAGAPDPIDTAPAAAWSRSLASALPVAASVDGALQGPPAPAPAALADLRAWLPGSSADHDRRAS